MEFTWSGYRFCLFGACGKRILKTSTICNWQSVLTMWLPYMHPSLLSWIGVSFLTKSLEVFDFTSRNSCLIVPPTFYID